MPVTAKLAPSVTPPAPFNVKLVNVPANNPAGKLIAEPFVNATVELILVAFIVPDVLVGLLPEMVKVLAPTVRTPLVAA